MTMEESRPSPSHVTDLTHDTWEQVLNICRAFVECGAYVLHGSNVRPPLRRIEPRQANDAAKHSGNHVAVYASVDVDVVLMHAVLDREYLSSRLDSYTIGYRSHAGTRLFKATDNLYQLFKQRDPRLYSDGHVYVMDRTCFISAPDSGSEFLATRALVPQKILKISASLSAYLFRINTLEGNDTIVPYSAEDERMLAAHRAKLEYRDRS